MNKIERRYVEQRFTVSDDESPKIRGYAAVFNSPSEDMGFVEKVDPHAFDDTLNADVRALWNHDANVVLGRTVSGTLRLSVDAKGLAYEIDPPDTQAARDLMVLMKRGDVNSSSFGFVTEEDKWDYNTNPATRTLLKVSLFDVSPVTYPAYAAASSEARNFPDGLPESVIQARSAQDSKEPEGDKPAADPDTRSDKCTCPCESCAAGDCDGCTDPDCECESCTCGEQRCMAHLRLQLAVASTF